MSLSIIILAAGLGKRMNSQLPKVLHSLAGKPLIRHVIETSLGLSTNVPPIVITGHQQAMVRKQLAGFNITWVEQVEPLGTGHAVLQALPHIPEEGQVLILYGDVPLISLETLQRFIATTPNDAVGIITSQMQNP